MNHVNLKKPSLYIIINSRNNSRQLFLLRKISENVQLILRVRSSGKAYLQIIDLAKGHYDKNN